MAEVTGREGAAPDVTIVITSYNQGPWIGEAIASALAQRHPCRVVVVDDGSSDGSVATARGLGVEVVARDHAGAIATFRAGVDLVRTPFYLLLNADDVLEPDYVEATLPLMADRRVAFVYTGVRYIGARSGVVSVPQWNAGRLRWGNFAHAASLVRKSAYDAVGGFDPAFADHHEDWALWVAMAAAGWRGAAVDWPLLRYRQHQSASRNRVEQRAVELARWRLARRHARWYGPLGFLRLVASSVRLAVTGS